VASDEDLLRAFGDGDERAYARLYDRHRRPLFLFGARMLGDGEAARDLVQDVFLALLERRGELRDVRSARAWLFTVARNRCLTRLRQRRTRNRLDEVVAGEAADAPGPPDSDEDAVFVRRALAELPDEQREILVLREYQEFSYREIAVIAQTTESAVKSRLFRARQALCERLRPLRSQGDEPCGARTEGSD
jgi:RNA polymerase sigma-70 factor, ECF subfamily